MHLSFLSFVRHRLFFPKICIACLGCIPIISNSALPVEFVTLPAGSTTLSAGSTTTIKLGVRNNTNRTLPFKTSASGTGFSVGSAGNSCLGEIKPRATCVFPVQFTSNTLGDASGDVFVSYGGRYSVSTRVTFSTVAATQWLSSLTSDLLDTSVQSLDAIDDGGGNIDILAGTVDGLYYRDGSAGLSWSDANGISTGPFNSDVPQNRSIDRVYIQDLTTFYAANGDGLFRTSNAGTSWTHATSEKASTQLVYGASTLTLTAKDTIASSFGNNWEITFDGGGANGNCLTGAEPITDNAATQTVTVELCKDGIGTLISTVTGVATAIGGGGSGFITASGTGFDLVLPSVANNLNQTLVGKRLDGLPQYISPQDGTTNKFNVFMARTIDSTGGDCSTTLTIAFTETLANSTTVVSEPGPGEVSVELRDVASVPNEDSKGVSSEINGPTGTSFSTLLYSYALGDGNGIVAPFTTKTLVGCTLSQSIISNIVGSGSTFLFGFNGRNIGLYSTTNGTTFATNGDALLLNQNVSALARVSATDYFVGIDTNGVARSSDGGSTWTDISNSNFTGLQVQSMTAPSSSTLYVGTSAGIYKSTNANTANPNDVVWTGISQSVAGLEGSIRVLASIDANTILAGTTSGLFETIDGGEVWENPGTIALDANADVYAIKVVDAANVLVGFTGGVSSR